MEDGSPPPPEAAVRVIRFVPAENTSAEVRKAAFCYLEDDGSFQLYTRKPGDGVYIGDYVVTFSLCEDTACQRSLIPQKYTTPAESPFEVTVDRAKSDYLFELERSN